MIRYPDTHRWGERDPRPVAECLQGLEDVSQYEGPHTIAAVFLETIVGTNGILIPPDGYLQGVREICDRHGILMVADEVMAGFGRTGRWFAVDHWGVVPDLLTMAKGLTSSYLPLGAVAMRHHIAEAFDTKMFYGGLTYSSHPVSLAAALATIGVYEEDGLIERAARLVHVMRRHHEALAAKHPSVGTHRNLGLFGIVDLARSRDPYRPMTAFNGTSDEMKAVARHLREHNLYTMVVNNSIHTNPPLSITEEQLPRRVAISTRPRPGRRGRPQGADDPPVERPRPPRTSRGSMPARSRRSTTSPDRVPDPALVEAEVALERRLEAFQPPTPRRARRVAGPGSGRSLVRGIVAASPGLWEAAKWGRRRSVGRLVEPGIPVSIVHVPPAHWTPVNDINLPTSGRSRSLRRDRRERRDAGPGSPGRPSSPSAGRPSLRPGRLGRLLLAVLRSSAVMERAILPLLVPARRSPSWPSPRSSWWASRRAGSRSPSWPLPDHLPGYGRRDPGEPSADPRAYELMRSYAARDRTVLWRLRLPASTPYLFTAFKIAATASVVGSIVGELPSGIRDGLGGTLLTAMQYYAIQPERLWAAIAAAAALGVVCFVAVVVVERWALRNYRPTEPGAAA